MSLIKYKDSSSWKNITPNFIGYTMETGWTSYDNNISSTGLSTAHPTHVSASARKWGSCVFLVIGFDTIGGNWTTSDSITLNTQHRPKDAIQPERVTVHETSEILCYCNIYTNGTVQVCTYGPTISASNPGVGYWTLAYHTSNSLIS